MDKLKFAELIGYISAYGGKHLDSYAITDVANIVELIYPVKSNADPALVNALLKAMNTEDQKIEAIKVYRALTGMSLKESKDAVEAHWKA